MTVFVVTNVFNDGADVAVEVFPSRAAAEAWVVWYVLNGFCQEWQAEENCAEGLPTDFETASVIAWENNHEWISISEREIPPDSAVVYYRGTRMFPNQEQI
jgi:hypothetical protein